MKGGIAAAAIAALATGANAINHRHAHEVFHNKRVAESDETCGCTTIWETITGEPTLVFPPPSSSSTTPTSTSTPAPITTSSTSTSSSTSSSIVTPTSTVKLPVPTPEPITCPTPGTYTFPATTVTLSETTTVCVGTSTHVPSGTHTFGGVTTVVETATTVTCPVATVTTIDGVVTSTIVSTEYVCPTAGTYTIAPITSTVTEECDIEYPVPTVYPPGTYTAPELVITVTETGFVTVCPYTSSEAPKPTSHPPPPPPPATTSKPAPSPEVPEVEEPEEDEDEEEHDKPSGGFDGTLGSNGDHYGITYTPYDGQTGECKSADQVSKDIKEIKDDGFNVVRVYSTDCDTLPSVGDACKTHGVRMMVGVFVKASGCSYDVPEIKEQVDAIAEWAQWDIVDLVIVGNEAVMNNFCTPSELRELIKVVKTKCSSYTGPFTIAETLNIWERSEVSDAICDVIDFTGANIHPYFNPTVDPESAGEFVQGQLDLLDEICPGKKAFNLECGWPTDGVCNGLACPGSDNQAKAIKSIRDTCGGKTVFFSFENDLWKEPGDCGCEQSWGSKSCFELF